MKKIILTLIFASITIYTQSQTSIELNGSSDFVSIQDNPSLDISGNFTIEAWIKPDDISFEKTIIIKGNSSQCGNYGLFIKDGNLAYVSGGECGWNGRGANSNLQINVWQHVAAVGDGTTLRLYINGTMTDETTMSSLNGSLNSDDLWVGRSVFSTNNFFFDGIIDEVRIWNQVRSQAEIQNNLNTELSGLESNLVAYYKFDDIETECDIEDCSNNENHGTRINISNSTNPPTYINDQPTNLTNVDCGVTFNDCITFAGEFQLFVDSIMMNLQSPNDINFLNDVNQVTQAIEDLKYYYNNRTEIVDEYYNFLENMCTTYPVFFQVNQTYDDTQYLYLGSFREQVHMFLRDYLRYYPQKENQFLSALDLSNSNAIKYLNIWNDYEILVVDNYSLTNLQLDVISNILATIPNLVSDLGTILYREFYTDNYQNAIYNTQFESTINSFAPAVGSGTSWPSSLPNNVVMDGFSYVLTHEICHTIDFDYLQFNQRLLTWKNSMSLESNTLVDEYLTRWPMDTYGLDFYVIQPQEFFAYISGAYFSNSLLTLDFAITKFNDGFQQPINQFLLMADALSSEGNTTQFYRIDENSDVVLTSHDIERNVNGFIDKIYITNQCAIEFTYDANNFVESMVIPDLNSNACDPSLSITDIDIINNIKIFPNPTDGLLHLSNGNSDSKFDIRVYDIYGKVIFAKNKTNQIDLAELNDGVYFVESTSILNNSRTVRKVIKK
jgi:hypothetical protein